MWGAIFGARPVRLRRTFLVNRRRHLAALLGAAALAVLSPLAPVVAADDGKGLVLVAGATGRTGRHVVTELRAQGYPVRALVRDRNEAGDLATVGAEVVEGDVRDPATLKPVLTGVKAVISALGSSRGDPANGPEQVDFQGVANLAKAAADAGATHFVLISSAGVTQEDHVLNRMFNNVLKWKARGEEAVRASGLAWTIVRPGGLSDKPGGETAVRLEQGDKSTGLIARADVARICVAALSAPAARNLTFEAFAGTGAPQKSAADWNALFATLKPDPAPAASTD